MPAAVPHQQNADFVTSPQGEREEDPRGTNSCITRMLASGNAKVRTLQTLERDLP